jgi:hypothetical protein
MQISQKILFSQYTPLGLRPLKQVSILGDLNPLRPSATKASKYFGGFKPPSAFGHSPPRGEKIYFAIGFFAPSGGDAA